MYNDLCVKRMLCVSVCLHSCKNICLLFHEKRETESGHKRGMNLPPTVFDVEQYMIKFYNILTMVYHTLNHLLHTLCLLYRVKI